MREAIEDMMKATEYLRSAMSELSNEDGTELLRAHEIISRVRSKVETDVNTQKFERALGLSH